MRSYLIFEMVLSGSLLIGIYFCCLFLYTRFAEYRDRPSFPGIQKGEKERKKESGEEPAKRANVAAEPADRPHHSSVRQAAELLREREAFQRRLQFGGSEDQSLFEVSLDDLFEVRYSDPEETESNNTGEQWMEQPDQELSVYDDHASEEDDGTDDLLQGLNPYVDPDLAINHLVKGHPPLDERVIGSYRCLHDTELMKQFETTGFFSEEARQRKEILLKKLTR